ncbi:MAG: OmpH family outer membrane protein [Candidatus Shapirobacteria bacterium]|jgi:outer membrane protein
MMNKNAKIFCASILLLLLAIYPAASQQITRVAVIDMTRILAAFPKDSAALKDFEARKAEVQAEVDKEAAAIKELQTRKTVEDAEGRILEAQALSAEITSRTAALREYLSTRQNELDLLAKALSSSASFVQKLGTTIARVAEAEGYSLVLNLKPQDQNANIVLWNSASIDITDKVIQAISGQN